MPHSLHDLHSLMDGNQRPQPFHYHSLHDSRRLRLQLADGQGRARVCVENGCDILVDGCDIVIAEQARRFDGMLVLLLDVVADLAQFVVGSQDGQGFVAAAGETVLAIADDTMVARIVQPSWSDGTRGSWSTHPS